MRKILLLSLIIILVAYIPTATEKIFTASEQPAKVDETTVPEPTVVPEPTLVPEPTPEWALEGWDLVWHDEFDGDTLDAGNWTFDLGAGGWGNNEWQLYTNRPENIRLEDGFLIIEAREEDYRGSDYTSARIKTQTLQQWTYGRVEARIKLPAGKGIWPAFWMLGEDVATTGWPDSGEIDVMENIGDPTTVYGTVHGPGYSGGGGIGSPYFHTGEPLNESFHTYAIEWVPGEITWYMDGNKFHIVRETAIPGDWVFDHPFFVILNLAVGGQWPGYPDDTTVFPQQLVVDYVRVYIDPNMELPELPTDEIRIADIRMDLEKVDDVWEAEVSISVVDQLGNPVEGIAIEGAWLGVITGPETNAITNADGIAGPLKARQNPFAGEISFCVIDAETDLYLYNKDANEATCIFIDPEENTP